MDYFSRRGMCARKISLMRACQPLPSCRNASNTSWSSRRVWLTFLSPFGGLPRLRRTSSSVAFFPINSGSASAAGRALAKSSFVHSGFSSSGRDARSLVSFAIQSYLSSVCLAEADDPQILAARRHDCRMQTAVEERHHQQARLALIAAGVFRYQRRVPFEFGHPLERQPALGNVPGVLLRVERDSHMGN